MIGPVILIMALLIAFTLGPLLLACYAHPSVGCVAAVAASMLWVKLVRTMPGYVQGIVSLTGVAAIVATVLACLALWVAAAIA
jgi:hypothetical protein